MLRQPPSIDAWASGGFLRLRSWPVASAGKNEAIWLIINKF